MDYSIELKIDGRALIATLISYPDGGEQGGFVESVASIDCRDIVVAAGVMAEQTKE